MKHRNAKLTACVLTGAMIFSVSSMITDAGYERIFDPDRTCREGAAAPVHWSL